MTAHYEIPAQSDNSDNESDRSQRLLDLTRIRQYGYFLDGIADLLPALEQSRPADRETLEFSFYDDDLSKIALPVCVANLMPFYRLDEVKITYHNDGLGLKPVVEIDFMVKALDDTEYVVRLEQISGQDEYMATATSIDGIAPPILMMPQPATTEITACIVSTIYPSKSGDFSDFYVLDPTSLEHYTDLTAALQKHATSSITRRAYVVDASDSTPAGEVEYIVDGATPTSIEIDRCIDSFVGIDENGPLERGHHVVTTVDLSDNNTSIEWHEYDTGLQVNGSVSRPFIPDDSDIQQILDFVSINTALRAVQVAEPFGGQIYDVDEEGNHVPRGGNPIIQYDSTENN